MRSRRITKRRIAKRREEKTVKSEPPKTEARQAARPVDENMGTGVLLAPLVDLAQERSQERAQE